MQKISAQGGDSCPKYDEDIARLEQNPIGQM